MNKKEVVIAIILISIFSFAIGFYYGAKTTINYGVDLALRFVDLNKLNITVDPYMLKTGIMQFENHIGGCAFMGAENSSILHN